MSKKNKSTNKRIQWLDDNLLTVLAGILLVAIPLYPKIPLFDAIPGYIVRVRLEDLLIGFTGLVWFVQVVRKKVNWKHPLTYLVTAYLTIGFLSTLSALFITRSVPIELLHAGKMYLHYFRRIEYFALLFIVYAAIKTKFHAKAFIVISAFTMIAVSIYGYGQKYLYWPVYSTMNREFAKGWKLYLTEHARVPSTFGGHYDLAAFTMITLTILLSLFLIVKNIYLKILFAVSFLTGFWLLILTASRTSSIAYLVAITTLMALYFIFKSWKWAIPRWFGVMAFTMFVMLSFGDLSERFTQIAGLQEFRDKYATLAFLPKIERPKEGTAVDPISLVTTPSDTPFIPEKPGSGGELPGDVYEDIPIPQEKEGGGYELVSRTYSDNAYKYGLSAAIRFDALWPRAWAGFQANPLLGTGYSTLTKQSVGQFTEAESTDNNYLRDLGETGLLGFVSFYSIIVGLMFLAITRVKHLKHEPLFFAFSIGMMAATTGLLLNAIYIDVFAASKIAETYWALAGILLAIIYKLNPSSKHAQKHA